MIKLNLKWSKVDDVERILYTISRWDFYLQYYDVNRIKLPIGLDRSKIKEYTKHEIMCMVNEEYLHNSTKIYMKVEDEIHANWKSVSDAAENIFTKINLSFPTELEIQLTCYGMGGSYSRPNKIILMAARFDPLATIVHELIHLTIEDCIQKYQVGQAQKERVVDLLMSKYFSHLFPDRMIPNWSQQVYHKIAYQRIDELFDKFEPDMKTVIDKVSQIPAI